MIDLGAYVGGDPDVICERCDNPEGSGDHFDACFCPDCGAECPSARHASVCMRGTPEGRSHPHDMAVQ